MANDLISVVVPAYNNGPWLPRCLESLLAQTYENLEIIVVNDGSKDDTREVLDGYAARYSRIKAIHKENGGVTSARLRGVAEAKGRWIGFVDGDDETEPDMYERLLCNAHTREADISHCGHQILFPDGRIAYVHNSGAVRIQDRMTGLRDLLDGSQIESGLWNKLYRRELFEGLAEKMDFSIRNNEDLLMNYHLFSQAKKAVYEDFCPYHYILRVGSASYRVLNEHSLFDPIRVRKSILEMAPEELRSDARIALMRNCLFAYSQLALHPDKQYEDFRKRVRDMVAEQKPYYALLSKRNRVLSEMICRAPWTFHIAYRTYVKLFQREEQH